MGKATKECRRAGPAGTHQAARQRPKATTADATEHISFTPGVARELAAHQVSNTSEDGEGSTLTGEPPLPGPGAPRLTRHPQALWLRRRERPLRD